MRGAVCLTDGERFTRLCVCWLKLPVSVTVEGCHDCHVTSDGLLEVRYPPGSAVDASKVSYGARTLSLTYNRMTTAGLRPQHHQVLGANRGRVRRQEPRAAGAAARIGNAK